ncbi:MAG TPA: TraR/DksA C4-type zinc finger protein [Anaerolineae bacterium]|nr:TraR/DksA C4-type zinc finger protein [Anaerolineae bacterium]
MTKRKLQEQIAQALKELEQLDRRLQQKADYGPGKGDPAIYDWELALALRRQAKARVETTQKALERHAEGRYGVCEQCGALIDAERLEAVPLATLCITCARSSTR